MHSMVMYQPVKAMNLQTRGGERELLFWVSFVPMGWLKAAGCTYFFTRDIQ